MNLIDYIDDVLEQQYQTGGMSYYRFIQYFSISFHTDGFSI